MLDVAAAAGAERWLFFHPTRGERDSGGALAEAAFSQFSTLARARGAAVIDGRSIHAGAAGARIYADDIHPTPEGAAAIAAALTGEIQPALAARCP